jgi:hypothetical protein
MVPLSCLNSKIVIYDWLVQDIGPCGAFFIKETNGQNLLQKMEKRTTWVNASRVQTQSTPTPFCTAIIKETLEAFVHCPYFCYNYFLTN